MPLTRYQIRNEFSLADPELYKAADKDDPEALLEGVAMAGLVGVLRQLGDLAEFAAEIFHDLHEEVMATAARGHGLMARVQQLEVEFPSIEKAFLCQTNHSLFFTSAGVDWHPNLRTEHNLITRVDLPRCVLDSYEECRGPPRLFLLDKFDVAGAGACLKRYSDPSFFKTESSFCEFDAIEVQREKKARKVKKKGSRWRNGETPEVAPTSHAKLHQLFLEERLENAYNDPARLVKLKRRQLNESPLDSKSGKSYMEKLLESPPSEHKTVYETSDTPLLLKMIPDNSSESGLEIVEISAVSPSKYSSQGKEHLSSSPDAQEVFLRSSIDELNGDIISREIVKMREPTADSTIGIEKDIMVDEEGRKQCSIDGDHSDDMISEVDNYMDALTTMGSEMDTDNEYRPKNDIGIIGKYQTDSDANEEKLHVQAHTSDSQSVGISSMSGDGKSSFRKGRSSCSYSETMDSMTEDMPSEGEAAAKAFPHDKNFVEIVEAQSIKLHAYSEMPCSTADKALSPKDTFAGERMSPHLEELDGSCLDDMNSTHVKLDLKASSILVSLVEPQLDEVPHEDVKSNFDLSDGGAGKKLVDSSEVTFSDSCQKQEDTLITCSAESHHVDGLGSRDTDVYLSAHALSHSSNASLLIPEENSNGPIDEVPKTGSAIENCAESPVDQIFRSSNSDILPAEELLPCLTLTEVERCSAIKQSPEDSVAMMPVSLASEVADATSEAAIDSDCMTPMVDTSHTCGFNEQQNLDISHDDLQLEGDSAELVALYSKHKQNVEEPFDAAKGEETCRVRMVEKDIIPCDLPSDCAHNLELGNCVDDPATENIDAEEIAVSAAASGSAGFDDGVDNTLFSSSTLICSPSSNLMNLQEPLSGAGDLCEGGLESNEVISQECLIESEARNQVKGAPPTDVDYSTRKLATYDNSNLEDDIQHLSLAKPTKNILSLTSAPAPSELSDQEMESISPSQVESRSDVVSSPTHYLSEKETTFKQSLDLHTDLYDAESPLVVEDSSDPLNLLSNQMQSLDHRDQEICFQNSSEVSEQVSSRQPSSEVSQQSDLHDNQEMFPSDMAQSSFGLLHDATKVSLEEMPPLPPLPPMQWRIGRFHNASPASQREYAEHGQGSFPMIPPYATEQKAQFGLSELEQGIEQKRSLPMSNGEESAFHLPNPLVTDFTLPDPFPIHQPTIGNFSNSQDNGIGLDRTNRNPFLTLFTASSETLECGSIAMEDDRVESSQSLMPMVATEYTNSIHIPLSSQEKIANTPMQFVPDTGLEGGAFKDPKQNSEREHGNPNIFVGPVNKAEEQSPTKLVDEAHTEVVKQFPTNVEDQPQHGLGAIERKTALTSNAIFLHGLAVAEGETTDTSNRNLPHDFSTSEGESTQTSNTNVQHDFSTSEGAAAWPPHTLALSPIIDDGSMNGNPTVKPPRPRNPLIDAVAAHDKSKMRKVTEVRAPTIPKVDERDSLLEQIRAKSFNLKPAVVTRPASIQGPKTNLRVAAILEKANAIRQALAGSDEDDDEDGWSDS